MIPYIPASNKYYCGNELFPGNPHLRIVHSAEDTFESCSAGGLP